MKLLYLTLQKEILVWRRSPSVMREGKSMNVQIELAVEGKGMTNEEGVREGVKEKQGHS